MREVLFRIVRSLVRADADPLLIDHVPVGSDAHGSDLTNDEANERDRIASERSRKLSEAHKKHGKAFKCAARDLPAEVMTVPGGFRIMKPGRPRTRVRPELTDPGHKHNVELLRRKT